MKTDRVDAVFFISKRRIKSVRWSLLVFGLGSLFYAGWVGIEYTGSGIGIPWWILGLAALSFGFVAFHRAWVLFHREHFVVRIGDEELEWGSTYYVTRKRHRVPFRDRQSIRWNRPRRIEPLARRDQIRLRP